MGEKLRLIRAIPGPSSLPALVAKFAKVGEGSISALDDAMLPALNDLVDEDSDVKVVPFGDLVRLSLREAGEEVLRLATTDQMAAALGRAASGLRDDSELRRSIRFPGIRKALARTLKELEEWGYDLDLLAERSSGALEERIRDLRDLRSGALSLLKEIGRDTHVSQIKACLESISDPEARPSRMLVFIGAEAPPAKLDWLKWAAGRGAEVQVVIDRHATDGSLFSHSEAVAARLGFAVEERGSGNRLVNNLFAQTSHGGPPLRVGIESAADPLSECEWALRGCLALKGRRSAAIYVRSLESYAPLLKSSAERLGVQVKVQSRVPLLENAFARFSLEILEACAGNDVRLFLPVVRSSYLALSGSQRSQLQAALRDAKTRKGRQWEELAVWLAGSDDSPKWLLEVLRWRDAVMKAPGTLREWHQQLREVIGSFLHEETLRRSPGYDPQRDNRAFNAMHIALENEAVLGASGREQILSLAEFVRRCRTVWEAADVSIPAGDGIPVVRSAGGLGGADAVFVLGMLEGVFPRRRSEEPILSDEAREEISRLMPECPPLTTSHDIAAAERDEFYRVCAAAKDSITFSYPETGEDRDNIPAFYLEVVKQAIGEDKVEPVVHPRILLAPKSDECLATADQELRQALDGQRRESPPCELTSVVAAREVHPREGEAFRPSELRDALQCPFRYQMRDRLCIPTRSRLSHWSRLRNLPQAAGLVKASDPEEARRLLEQALDSELDLIVAEAPDWELKLLRAGGNRLIGDWLQREFRAREVWPREVEAVDVRIGEHGLRDTLRNRKLEGTVPAVSHLKAGAKLLHLYTMRAREEDELTDPERLYVGLYFGMGFETGREVALELEGSGGRTLLVLTRAGIGSLRADVRNGLKVTDLSTTEDPVESKNDFGRETARLLKAAFDHIDRGEIRPEPGSHCDFCDFGELCRRSAQFSDDDSPFGEDEALGAA